MSLLTATGGQQLGYRVCLPALGSLRGESKRVVSGDKVAAGGWHVLVQYVSFRWS